MSRHHREAGISIGDADWKGSFLFAACRAGVGFLSGFRGVRGGLLIVPALVLFLGEPMKPAIGTSLFIIGANCALALWG